MSSFDFNPSEIEVDYKPPGPTGYSQEIEERDTTERLRGETSSRDFPDELYIDPSEWKQKARENDEARAWAEDNRGRFTNQHPTHECTCHSLLQGFEAARNAVYPGKQDWQVYVSAMSVYAEANPMRYGGAGCIEVLNIATDRGFLPEHKGPAGRDQTKVFKHTVAGTSGQGNADQSAGPWLSLRKFPIGWRATAKHFRVLESIVVETIEQAVSLVLHGRVINVGRNGHAVPWNRVRWTNEGSDPYDGLHMIYPDSYDVIRADSFRTARGALNGASCIWSVTLPDDFNRPAGEDGGSL